MPNPQVSARVGDDVVARIATVRVELNRARLEGDPELDQGDVVRRALLLGLREMEADLGIVTKKGPAPARKSAKK